MRGEPTNALLEHLRRPVIERLFVYGTLLRSPDGRIHPLLSPGCTFESEAIYTGILYDLGPFPGVVPSSADEHRVHGELYRMDSPENVLGRLDQYEGSLYRREIVDAYHLEDDETVAAWIYLYTGPLDKAVRVPSGDYRDRDE